MSARLHMVLAVALGVAYALGSLWLMNAQPGSLTAILVVLGPMTVLSLLGLWRKGTRVPALLLGALAIALGAFAWRREGVTAEQLYLAQHAGVHLMLAAAFGWTLRSGSTPLITQLAGRLQAMTPGLARYTGQVTWAWVAYFVAMSLASVVIYELSFAAWSWFANVFTPLGAALMMGSEYLLRYRLHPEFERIDFAAAWRAYQAHGAQAAQPHVTLSQARLRHEAVQHEAVEHEALRREALRPEQLRSEALPLESDNAPRHGS